MRELQRSILEAAGYRVETAERRPRGARAAATATASIDLVVTDVEMPEMDGFELTQAIRARTRARVAAGRDRHLARRARRTVGAGVEAGADAYMVKDEFDQQRAARDGRAAWSGA